MAEIQNTENNYSASNIQVLEGLEAVRKRPAMYIGDISEKGLHHLVNETVDNSIDEAMAGYCTHIEVTINEDESITVQDNGRGIPIDMHEKLHKSALEVVMTVLHAGGKFDKGSYKVSGGLHGVGVSCVNALSTHMKSQVFRDGKIYQQEYEKGKPLYPVKVVGETELRGTRQQFWPDPTVFTTTHYQWDIIARRMRELAFLNAGIKITLRDMRPDEEGKTREEVFHAKDGLKEFVRYIDRHRQHLFDDVIYLKTEKQNVPIEIAIMYNTDYSENLHSYVNNINTEEGGTHLSGFRKALTRTINAYARNNKILKDNEDALSGDDVREGLTAVLSLKVPNPQFESQTKIKLGSLTMAPDKDMNGNPFPLSGVSVNKFVGDFVKENVDNYLHMHTDVADIIKQKIEESEKERKAIAGVTKLARERAKKANLHNRKLRDCRVHLNDPAPKSKKKNEDEDYDPRLDSAIFITEGDSASGSITKSRDVNTQAVFSLRGKPLNCFGLTKKVVYENEEFNLLQAALNIEDGLDGLRYNKVIVATDADVDGMHIRLLMITFFLQFFPDLIKKGHVFILQTPLFRVRNKKKKVRAAGTKTPKTVTDKSAGAAILKKAQASDRSEFETIYCYSEEERLAAIERLSPDPEITRFKGLGEISPDEFKNFIGPDIRLEPVTLHKSDNVGKLLEYYMGKNTMERQGFIIDNLVVEEDLAEDEEAM